MKQLLQRLDTGETTLLEVPVPGASGPTVVVATGASLISSGTERMLVEFGRSSLLAKARQQPDRVRQVLDKVRTDGLRTTLEAVRSKLDTPIAMGYCNAGTVVDVGDATPFCVGDRVVTNGPHAEFVRVPHILAARIPQGLDFEAAAFTPVAAIGLEGIRLAQPTLGETVVVYGLGLIGLLTVQLLRANGCQVLGIDRSTDRLDLAARFGADPIDARREDVVARVMTGTDGVGADAVLLTLDSDADEPVQYAAEMSRKRGRIVLVGVTGLRLKRDEFFKKELSFQVSCSYGPGRYDPAYEQQARDYPVGYVRWTEQRNFAAVLQLMASGAVDPSPLITHRFPFSEAPQAYGVLTGDMPSLGVVLQYPSRTEGESVEGQRTVERATVPVSGEGIGVIGAGNFAVRTILPITKRSGVRHRIIASGGGTSGAVAAEKFNFERVTTSSDEVLQDSDVASVMVLTRHDSHAALAERALQAGKHVFVEKPLALTEDELESVAAAARASGRMLMVGFNRRFAPYARTAREELATRAGPAVISIMVNAGHVPRDHWTQDPVIGGGRIIGEACHFLDLARFLVGTPITDLKLLSARAGEGSPVDDVATIIVRFVDGSIATIQYLANGPKSYPKERVECFFDGRALAIDNWRRLQTWGSGLGRGRRSRQDKGHQAELDAWLRAVKDGGPAPIPLEEIIEISRWSIRAGEMAGR